MRVQPMPTMQSQVGTFGLMIFADLNCGWYCTESMLQHWFEKLSQRTATEMPLPCGKVCAYHPYFATKDVYKGAILSWQKPTDVGGWETHLNTNGPTVVSGKLGVADWGKVGETLLGVGHFVLVVGADANAGTIDYKDPLVGDTLKTYNFTDMNPRIDAWVYGTSQVGALTIFNAIGAK